MTPQNYNKNIVNNKEGESKSNYMIRPKSGNKEGESKSNYMTRPKSGNNACNMKPGIDPFYMFFL